MKETNTCLPPQILLCSNNSNELFIYDDFDLVYDNNGNLVSKTNRVTLETKTFTWDARNRLTDISGPGLTASFDYDALGRRISKIINGTTTTFVYDGWDIIQETVIDGPTTNYTRTLSIDEPLAFERTDGTIRYYVQDVLGSVVALTDAEGLVTTTYEYDAFGAVTINGPDDQPFQYTGRENDGTGLYYYRARYYSPEMRRFISEDPIGLNGGINYYAYVDNSPLNWIDPFGLLLGGREAEWRKPTQVPVRDWDDEYVNNWHPDPPNNICELGCVIAFEYNALEANLVWNFRRIKINEDAMPYDSFVDLPDGPADRHRRNDKWLDRTLRYYISKCLQCLERCKEEEKVCK